MRHSASMSYYDNTGYAQMHGRKTTKTWMTTMLQQNLTGFLWYSTETQVSLNKRHVIQTGFFSVCFGSPCIFTWAVVAPITFTIDFQFIAVEYNTSLQTAQQGHRWNFGQTLISEKIPHSSSSRVSYGRSSWILCRKVSFTIWHWNLLLKSSLTFLYTHTHSWLYPRKRPIYFVVQLKHINGGETKYDGRATKPSGHTTQW